MTLNMLLARRRAMMGQSGSLLPSGYTQLEYIKGNSKSIVISKINSGDTFVFEAEESSPASVRMLLAHSENAGGWCGIINTGKWATGGSSGQYLDISCTQKIIGIVTFENTLVTLKVGDETCSRTSSYSLRVSNKNLYVFGDSGTSYYSRAKLYKLQHFRNGEMIANFIPCTETATSKTGFYDVINDTFIEY